MKVLIGPSNSGKSERVISRVGRAIIEARGQVHLIVPSSHAASAMSERLNASLSGSAVNTRQQAIITFPKFYSAILEKLGRNLFSLNIIERGRLLRRVIRDLAEAGKLVYFAETAQTPGLVKAVAGFIDELWQSGTSPEALNLIAQSRGEKDRDIALIYQSYEAALASMSATESEAAGCLALQALETSSRNLNLSLIAVDGFDFYSPVQARLLSSLASRGVETIVTLTYEEGRAVHLWQKPTIERLCTQGAGFDHCPTSPKSLIEVAAARLMTDDLADGSDERQENDAIEIISAPGRAAEVRAIAREIKRLVHQKNYAIESIAIVCRSLSLYAHYLERVFNECSIPLTLDCPLAVAENPAILALLRMLELSSKSFARRASIESLRSPYFDFLSFGLDESSIDLLDGISIEKNVTRGRDQWLTAIESFATAPERERRKIAFDQVEEESGEERASRYSTLRENLKSFFDHIVPPVSATRDAYAHWVMGITEKFRVEELANAGETARRDKKALAEFREMINALAADRVSARTTGEQFGEVTWPGFFTELESAVNAVTFEREAPARPCVVAQEAHNIRPRRYRALFVLGLVEGEFPAKSVERPPYTNIEREELREAGIDLTETTTDPGADLAQFCKAMSRATERLYLTYSRTDVTGGELLPSYLIEEVSAVAPVKEARIAQSAKGNPSIWRDAASIEELSVLTARSVGASANNGRLFLDALDDDARAASRLLEAELPSWKTTLRGAAVEHQRLNGRERGCFDGMIRECGLIDHLRQRFGPEHLWSASQINDYGSCPFRFFAKHALKLEPANEPGEGFASDRLGNAYHKILERLYARLMATGLPVSAETSEEVADLVSTMSDEVLSEMLEDGTIRKNAMWDFDKSEIKRRVARLLLKEAEWNEAQTASPLHLERKFGIDGQKPLVIKTEDTEVKLCGQIDRIDRRDDGWVVVDYKTGRTPVRHSDALDGRNLQLPIYAMAATRVIDQSATVVSAYYLHIRSRKKGSELPRKDDARLSVEAMIEHAEKLILAYAERARGGVFPIMPNDHRCYPGCDYDVMCRVQSLGSPAGDE